METAEHSWKEKITNEFKKPYFVNLRAFLKDEYEKKQIFPPKSQVFQAFKLTSFEQVKVVLLGQDPYHGPNQAMGLSFSVPRGQKLPPSLKNIYKEISDEYEREMPTANGDLTSWATQGVLLLNTVLTVEMKNANAHAQHGWETFTDTIIERLNEREKPVIFLLLGSQAIQKRKLVTNAQHVVLQSTHPSPLSAYRGFLGSGIFRQVNQTLEKMNETPIDWFSVKDSREEP